MMLVGRFRAKFKICWVLEKELGSVDWRLVDARVLIGLGFDVV